MGREVKRVALDFDYPIKVVWYGYLIGIPDNFEERCPDNIYDKWEKKIYASRIDPPKGEGWQMWENTSEGSPVSPVFKTPEELAKYCEKHVTTFGTSHFTTKEAWLKMIKIGFAPSGIMVGGEFKSGVDGISQK